MEKKAVIFPGQGSQYPQMGLSLYQNYQKSKQVFDRVDDISGIEVTKAMFEGQASQLKDTAIQQLAILAVSLAAYQQIRDQLRKVVFLSGLSLGEYSCLYAAEVLSLDEVITLVKTRAEAMQKAADSNPSSMLAVIGTTKKALEIKEKELGFYIANINAPSQVVISVKKEAKHKLKTTLEEEGLKVVELAVSGGFHSPFMEPAKAELKEVIDKLRFCKAQIPIVSNVTATSHTEASQIKENLLAQLVSPVLWAKSVEYMAKRGVSCFYEVGPAKVLRALIRKIDKSLKVTNVESKEDIEGVQHGVEPR